MFGRKAKCDMDITASLRLAINSSCVVGTPPQPRATWSPAT
jgi:hypothetical protein